MEEAAIELPQLVFAGVDTTSVALNWYVICALYDRSSSGLIGLDSLRVLCCHVCINSFVCLPILNLGSC